jgi:hypothetical protein
MNRPARLRSKPTGGRLIDAKASTPLRKPTGGRLTANQASTRLRKPTGA